MINNAFEYSIYRFFGLRSNPGTKQIRNFAFCIGIFLGITVSFSLDHNKKVYDFVHQNLLKNGGEFPLFASAIVFIIGFLMLRKLFCNYTATWSDTIKLRNFSSNDIQDDRREHNPFSNKQITSNVSSNQLADQDYIELGGMGSEIDSIYTESLEHTSSPTN